MTAASAMIMAVSLIGCRAGGKAATQAKKSGTADGMMIGLSMNTQTNPFFVSVQQGVKDAASKYMALKLWQRMHRTIRPFRQRT